MGEGDDAEVRDRAGDPGLGDASAEDLRAVAQKSNAVLAELAPQVQWVQWVQSYAT
jgi:hypothetical protein